MSISENFGNHNISGFSAVAKIAKNCGTPYILQGTLRVHFFCFVKRRIYRENTGPFIPSGGRLCGRQRRPHERKAPSCAQGAVGTWRHDFQAAAVLLHEIGSVSLSLHRTPTINN